MISFGDKTGGEYLPNHRLAELEPPVLQKQTGFGETINEIRTSAAWKYFKKESAIEGLVAIPYEAK